MEKHLWKIVVASKHTRSQKARGILEFLEPWSPTHFRVATNRKSLDEAIAKAGKVIDFNKYVLTRIKYVGTVYV